MSTVPTTEIKQMTQTFSTMEIVTEDEVVPTETVEVAPSKPVVTRSNTYQGRCKWFDFKKGFGFITTMDGSDIFVHQECIKSRGFRALQEGEPVEFDIATDLQGRSKAIEVTGPNGSFVRPPRRRFYPQKRSTS